MSCHSFESWRYFFEERFHLRTVLILSLVVLIANPNIASGAQDNFKTPLHTAAEHGFLSNVQILIEAGADPEICEGNGHAGIDLAERGGWKTLISSIMWF